MDGVGRSREDGSNGRRQVGHARTVPAHGPRIPDDMARRPPSRGLPATATIAFAIFVGLGAVSFFGGTIVPASDGLRYGFPAYYTSSRLVLEHEWGPAVYDNAWFSERSRELTGGEIAEIYRPNTPMMS